MFVLVARPELIRRYWFLIPEKRHATNDTGPPSNPHAITWRLGGRLTARQLVAEYGTTGTPPEVEWNAVRCDGDGGIEYVREKDRQAARDMDRKRKLSIREQRAESRKLLADATGERSDIADSVRLAYAAGWSQVARWTSGKLQRMADGSIVRRDSATPRNVREADELIQHAVAVLAERGTLSMPCDNEWVRKVIYRQMTFTMIKILRGQSPLIPKTAFLFDGVIGPIRNQPDDSDLADNGDGRGVWVVCPNKVDALDPKNRRMREDFDSVLRLDPAMQPGQREERAASLAVVHGILEKQGHEHAAAIVLYYLGDENAELVNAPEATGLTRREVYEGRQALEKLLGRPAK